MVQEFVHHKTFLDKRREQSQAHAEVKEEPSDDHHGGAAVQGATPSAESSRRLVLAYLEERMACLSPSLLQFVTTILRDGLMQAIAFESRSFRSHLEDDEDDDAGKETKEYTRHAAGSQCPASHSLGR